MSKPASPIKDFAEAVRPTDRLPSRQQRYEAIAELKPNQQDPADSRYFEPIVADLAANLVNVSGEALDRHIGKTLSKIGEILGAERVSLAFRDEMPGEFTNRYQWIRGVAEIAEHGEPIDASFPWLVARMNADTIVRIQTLEDWPAEAAAERTEAQTTGIRASVSVPFHLDGNVHGFFQLGRTAASARWPQVVTLRLNLLGEVLAGAIARRRSDQHLAAQLRFEQLIAEISSTFVRLAPGEVDREIQRAIAILGDFLGVELATVLRRDAGDHGWRHTHEWLAPGSSLDLPSFRGVVVTEASFPWLAQKLPEMVPIAIADPTEFPAGADIERRTAETCGMCSVLWVPFIVHGVGTGFLAFNAWTHRRWSPATIRRIGLLGDVIGSALARSQAETRLNEMNQHLMAENQYLIEETTKHPDFQNIIGRSDALKSVLYEIEQVAGTNTPVLLLGETGTGKGMFARALHVKSRRAERPLITVNCAALPGSLIEAELFGHEKGAFTGAAGKRTGRFKLADGATIFLDEVGDLPLELQAKLLRVLQDGEFEPLGSSKTVRVDIRVIAATNRDLKAGVEAGTFRADLYYRLNVFPIELPPLRARRPDIPLLVWYFIEKLKVQLDRRIEAVPADVMDWMGAYDWPGNVRELENVIERAMILSRGAQLELNQALRDTAPSADEAGGEELASIERAHIIGVLTACAWKIKGPGNAAERLGLHPNTLRYRMGKLGIERPT